MELGQQSGIVALDSLEKVKKSKIMVISESDQNYLILFKGSDVKKTRYFVTNITDMSQ